MIGDPFKLQRFVEAQANGVYEQAISELRSGEKRSHWIWFIFPQHRDLGRSAMANFFGVSGEKEAAAYLEHPLLGPRLRECVTAVREQRQAGKSLEEILGSLDAMKYRSSMELRISRRGVVTISAGALQLRISAPKPRSGSRGGRNRRAHWTKVLSAA